MLPTLDQAKFTYMLSGSPLAGLAKTAQFGDRVLSYSADMDCVSAFAQGREVIVLGLCVDARGQLAASDVPDFLLGQSVDFPSLLPLTDRLAGRFVIIYRDMSGLYAATDAAATLHVNYMEQGPLTLASSEQLLAKKFGLAPAQSAQKIWKGCTPSAKFLPSDMGMCEGIRFLQPNHYLGPLGAVRFFPKGWNEPDLTPKQAAERIVPLVRNAVKALSARLHLISGLTAGYDSRLVYAFLRESVREPFCYTYINAGFTASTPDLAVSKQLAELFHIRYEQVARERAPADFVQALKALCGSWTPDAQINAAYAFRQAGFGELTYVGGALVDQIGRDHVANGLSHRTKGERFIRSAERNYELLAWDEIHKWCEGASVDPGRASLVDLYAWECLCGRWATNPPLVHAMAGNGYLNIFNCREVLKTMLRVPSRDRFARKLHVEMYKMIAPELLDVPFNPPQTAMGRVKRTRPYAYLANYLGFLVRARRYRG